ncbi:kelch-like protein 9 [Podarcis raffonei]|uniref:kelch-like protein 9 n=1 Tax=Podarcis raffonei TaxID=65483 RepID=UPI0023298B44|nr:kelch-like protein 9 [Podarcis raffonei]
MYLASPVRAKSQSLCSDTYLSKLLEGLRNLRTKNILCDVTLEAEGVSFSAHKVILAAASNYCKMHFSRDAASHNSHIKLPRVTAQGLQNILSFVYSNKLELTLQNVEETFQAAEVLLVRDVMCLCFRFLDEGLDQNTCLAVLEIAKRLGPKELRQKAMSCVSRHCSNILADPVQLQELDAATLCEILDTADTEDLSELELFHAAECWLRHHNTHLEDAAEVLQHIRFPLIPLHDLQKFVQDVPFMKTEPTCRQYLQEALEYQSRLHAQPTLQSERTKVRAGVDMLVVLGGRSVDNTICGSMWAADRNCLLWKKVGELHRPLYNHCVAVIQGFVFVMGGQDRFDPTGQCPSNQVFRFDPRHGSWLQVASMLGRRTRFHAGVLNDCLVAVGGGALLGTLTDMAEEYQPAENKWQPITPFPMPVADHAGATHKGILYVSGGFAAGKPLRDTYSYLSRLHRWVRNQPMTFARCDHGMAVAGDRIFCVGGRALANAQEWVPVNETEYYCPVSDQWTLLSLSPFDLCQFGLAVHGQQLYITGGGSVRQKRKEDGVYICNPGGKVWEKAGSLPKPLVDHASFFVQLPRHLVTGEQQQNGEGPSAAGRKKSTLNLLITSKTSSQPALQAEKEALGKMQGEDLW